MSRLISLGWIGMKLHAPFLQHLLLLLLLILRPTLEQIFRHQRVVIVAQLVVAVQVTTILLGSRLLQPPPLAKWPYHKTQQCKRPSIKRPSRSDNG